MRREGESTEAEVESHCVGSKSAREGKVCLGCLRKIVLSHRGWWILGGGREQDALEWGCMRASGGSVCRNGDKVSRASFSYELAMVVGVHFMCLLGCGGKKNVAPPSMPRFFVLEGT